MSHLTGDDADLHHEDGTHRESPPPDSVRSPEVWTRRLRQHVEAHQTIAYLARMRRQGDGDRS